MRFDSQLSRMNCHTFSTGLSSGHLGGIELGASRRQRHQSDVGRNDQFGGAVPSSLIEKKHGVCARRDVEGDFFQMHAHRLAVAPGHDDAGGLAFSGTDRPEDPCRGPALIPWR